MQVSYLSASFGIIYVLVKPAVSSRFSFLKFDKIIPLLFLIQLYDPGMAINFFFADLCYYFKCDKLNQSGFLSLLCIQLVLKYSSKLYSHKSVN